VNEQESGEKHGHYVFFHEGNSNSVVDVNDEMVGSCFQYDSM
jgi:ribosomal protein S19